MITETGVVAERSKSELHSNSSGVAGLDPGWNTAWGRLYGNYYAHTLEWRLA